MKKYLDFKNRIEYEKLKEMGQIIREGEIVIFPTETVNYYIDGGKSKIGLGSTIVKIENNVPIILREGSITKEQIYKCIST